MMTIPWWFIIALAGHLANGGSFILDKMLLRRSFKHPETYAGIIGATGLIAVVLFPFGVHMPDALGWLWIALSGAAFVFSLLLFFAALAAGETSRVVPIIGSLIPMLTLAATSVFLSERLNTLQYVGFALLIVSTIILAGGPSHTRLRKRAIILAVSSAALFAFSSVTGKFAYNHDGFITAFTWSRLWGVVAALAIIAYNPHAEGEFMEALFKKPRRVHGHPTKVHPPTDRGGRKAAYAFIIGQLMGSLGFVGVQFATSLGSAALVNALQAVQYAFLVGVALLLRKQAHLLGEDLSHRTIIRKTVAIGIVAVGLWLVVV